MSTILISNRGEIAIRIAQAAYDLGLTPLGLYSEDDAESLHRRRVEQALPLAGVGPAAYLDQNQILDLARSNDVTLLHPGYGFLSENGRFAQRCAENGIRFVGPRPELIRQLGDKTAAKRLASELDIPLVPGLTQASSVQAVARFWDGLPAGSRLMLKAVAGGGGVGMQVVQHRRDLEMAWGRCQTEAQNAFGDGSLYTELYLPEVRHIEIQMIGDGKQVTHLWERDCSLQRRFQKMIEFAPAPGMSPKIRERLIDAAMRLAETVRLDSLTTFEFLVEGRVLSDNAPFYFIEANPRLQVEHTVTEEASGIDLVQAQIRLARGETLKDLGLADPLPAPKKRAAQFRITTESWSAEGGFSPTGGTLSAYTPPSGPGIRVDGYGAVGYATNPRFDSLLAKLIVSQPMTVGFDRLLQKGYRGLAAFELAGLETSLSFYKALLRAGDLHPEMLYTALLDQVQLIIEPDEQAHTAGSAPSEEAFPLDMPEGKDPLSSPMPGSLLQFLVEPGQTVAAGQTLFLIEAMKMENGVEAPYSARVLRLLVEPGERLQTGTPILLLEPLSEINDLVDRDRIIDLDHIRPDLAELFERRAFGLDENREGALAKRRQRGGRSGRANVEDLCDPGTFAEYGSAIVAAQRSRRSLDDLIQRTPADGLVAGFGRVNGTLFKEKEGLPTRCLIMAYDYTVLAGTQGVLNHKKMDRLLHLADDWEMPIILFAEGGGGRPGDVDYMGVAQLDVMTFTLFAKLSGRMPRIAVVNGYCFAGNAALAGAADVIIATESASLGMGGPAMIEGGGLGRYHPREVGPVAFQTTNGVIDVLVKDEAEGVAMAQKYLSYFQGQLTDWSAADQRLLRHAIPENRRRVYAVRKLIETLADTGSVLELRPSFGEGIITALVRIEGRPIGLIANNPAHLGGAIDVDSADKMARFMQLCDAFGLPLLSLVDTPGIMVGPEAEKAGTVRHAARLFVIGAALQVPFIAVILRKGYGLGAQAMCAGSFHVPVLTVAWPTGEFGAMGLEGAVRLGFRKELEGLEDPAERQALFEKMVAEAYRNGKALNTASYMELDEVIDPAETRARVLAALEGVPQTKKGGTNRYIDTW